MEYALTIFGIRAILEALQQEKPIDKVWLLKGSQSALYEQLLHKLRSNNIPFSFVPVERLERFSTKNHQGAVAILSPISLYSIEELIAKTYNKEKLQTYLLLDGITDTRNFGAIIRTSVAAGVTGIIISQNNSAPINSDVIKTSSGAAFKIPISKVQNLKDAIIHLRSLEINVFSLSEKATKSIYDINYNRSVGLIMGSEEKGITKGILKLSDETLKVPINPNIDSLNVSVAFAVVIFEIARQRIS